jgi:hypothetical protein
LLFVHPLPCVVACSRPLEPGRLSITLPDYPDMPFFSAPTNSLDKESTYYNS